MSLGGRGPSSPLKLTPPTPHESQEESHMPPFDEIAFALEELGLDAPEEQLVQRRAWTEVLSSYPSIEAWDVFAVCAEHMTDAEYFPTARHLWANSEDAFTEEQFDAVFVNHGRTLPQTGFMNAAEAAVLVGHLPVRERGRFAP